MQLRCQQDELGRDADCIFHNVRPVSLDCANSACRLCANLLVQLPTKKTARRKFAFARSNAEKKAPRAPGRCVGETIRVTATAAPTAAAKYRDQSEWVENRQRLPHRATLRSHAPAPNEDQRQRVFHLHVACAIPPAGPGMRSSRAGAAGHGRCGRRRNATEKNTQNR